MRGLRRAGGSATFTTNHQPSPGGCVWSCSMPPDGSARLKRVPRPADDAKQLWQVGLIANDGRTSRLSQEDGGGRLRSPRAHAAATLVLGWLVLLSGQGLRSWPVLACVAVACAVAAADLLRRPQGEGEEVAEQAALRRVATAVAEELDVPSVFALAAREAAGLFALEHGAVVRFDGPEQVRIVGAHTDGDPGEFRAGKVLTVLPGGPVDSLRSTAVRCGSWSTPTARSRSAWPRRSVPAASSGGCSSSPRTTPAPSAA